MGIGHRPQVVGGQEADQEDNPHAAEPPAVFCRRDATHKSVDRQVAIGQRCPKMEGDLQRTVGRNLRAYRQAKGLSQEAFADELKVHRTYMGGIERGERNLTLKSVESIAGRLDLDPLVLLTDQGLPLPDGES